MEIKIHENHLLIEDPTDPKFAKEVERLFGVQAENLDFKNEELMEKLRDLPTYKLRMQLLHGMDCTKAETFGHIVKKEYAAMVVDCNYHFDFDDDGEDASANGDKYTTAEGLKQMLNCFRQIQGVSKVIDYTVIVFCGFRQVEDFFKVMKEEFGPGRGQVFRYFWKKTPAIGAKNIHPERPTNIIECILVGVCWPLGDEKPAKWQANYGPNAEDRTNVLEVPSVLKKVRDPTSKTNLMGDWQKPRRLMRMLFERHCNKPGRWLLEPMCGSGTASVVALTMGMNVVAIDWNKKRVMEAGKRMAKMQDPLHPDIPSEEEEIRSVEEMKKIMVQRAEARALSVTDKQSMPEGTAGLQELLPGDLSMVRANNADKEESLLLLPAPGGDQPKEGGCVNMEELMMDMELDEANKEVQEDIDEEVKEKEKKEGKKEETDV